MPYDDNQPQTPGTIDSPRIVAERAASLMPPKSEPEYQFQPQIDDYEHEPEVHANYNGAPGTQFDDRMTDRFIQVYKDLAAGKNVDASPKVLDTVSKLAANRAEGIRRWSSHEQAEAIDKQTADIDPTLVQKRASELLRTKTTPESYPPFADRIQHLYSEFSKGNTPEATNQELASVRNVASHFQNQRSTEHTYYDYDIYNGAEESQTIQAIEDSSAIGSPKAIAERANSLIKLPTSDLPAPPAPERVVDIYNRIANHQDVPDATPHELDYVNRAAEELNDRYHQDGGRVAEIDSTTEQVADTLEKDPNHIKAAYQEQVDRSVSEEWGYKPKVPNRYEDMKPIWEQQDRLKAQQAQLTQTKASAAQPEQGQTPRQEQQAKATTPAEPVILTPADLAGKPSTQTINTSVRSLRPLTIDTTEQFVPQPETVQDINGKSVTSGITGYQRDDAGNITKINFVNPKDSADKYAVQSFDVKDGVLILPGKDETQVKEINGIVDAATSGKKTVTLAEFDKTLKDMHGYYAGKGEVPDIYNSNTAQLSPEKHIQLSENTYQKVAKPENMYVVEAPTGQTVGFQGSVSQDGHLQGAQYSSGSFVVVTGEDKNGPYARKLDMDYAKQNLRDAKTGQPIDVDSLPKVTMDASMQAQIQQRQQQDVQKEQATEQQKLVPQQQQEQQQQQKLSQPSTGEEKQFKLSDPIGEDVHMHPDDLERFNAFKSTVPEQLGSHMKVTLSMSDTTGFHHIDTISPTTPEAQTHLDQAFIKTAAQNPYKLDGLNLDETYLENGGTDHQYGTQRILDGAKAEYDAKTAAIQAATPQARVPEAQTTPVVSNAINPENLDFSQATTINWGDSNVPTEAIRLEGSHEFKFADGRTSKFKDGVVAVKNPNDGQIELFTPAGLQDDFYVGTDAKTVKVVAPPTPAPPQAVIQSQHPETKVTPQSEPIYVYSTDSSKPAVRIEYDTPSNVASATTKVEAKSTVQTSITAAAEKPNITLTSDASKVTSERVNASAGDPALGMAANGANIVSGIQAVTSAKTTTERVVAGTQLTSGIAGTATELAGATEAAGTIGAVTTLSIGAYKTVDRVINTDGNWVDKTAAGIDELGHTAWEVAPAIVTGGMSGGAGGKLWNGYKEKGAAALVDGETWKKAGNATIPAQFVEGQIDLYKSTKRLNDMVESHVDEKRFDDKGQSDVKAYTQLQEQAGELKVKTYKELKENNPTATEQQINEFRQKADSVSRDPEALKQFIDKKGADLATKMQKEEESKSFSEKAGDFANKVFFAGDAPTVDNVKKQKLASAAQELETYKKDYKAPSEGVASTASKPNPQELTPEQKAQAIMANKGLSAVGDDGKSHGELARPVIAATTQSASVGRQA